MNLELAAAANLTALHSNPYPGRGLIVGQDRTGRNMIQVYWIMGRSENSRNRVFEKEHDRVFTVAADPAKLKDPSLIIYNAMERVGGNFVVSNGDQTDTVVSAIQEGRSLQSALQAREPEPDAPNYTPRITAVTSLRTTTILQIAIIRRPRFYASCERHYFTYDAMLHGYGLCITTYTGDGDPLPSFTGEPFLLPLKGKYIKEVGENIWNVLNENNRVSLAIKYIDRASGKSDIKLLNKYKKV